MNSPKVIKLISLLKQNNLSFAIITGKFEEYGSVIESKNKNYHPDLDLVFFDISKEELHQKLIKIGLIHTEYNTYRHHYRNGSYVPIDIYIEYINTGYYYLFRIDKRKTKNYNGYQVIAEEDYIVYQFLEPLIKFSEYKPRHRYRLSKYLKEGYFTPYIKERLCKIIGCIIVKYILYAIENDIAIKKSLVRIIKLRLLFKYGNFSRMIQQRFIKNEK